MAKHKRSPLSVITRPSRATKPPTSGGGHTEAAFRHALELQAAGRNQEAAQACRRILETAPLFFPALSCLASLALEAGQPDVALQSLQQILAHLPEHPETLRLKCMALLQQGQFAEARACAGLALRGAPQRVETHFAWAIATQMVGDLPAAEAAYRDLLALAPEHFEAHHNLGVLLRQLGRFDESLCAYDRALAILPEQGEAQFGRAMLQILLGDYVQGWANHEWRWKQQASRGLLDAYTQPRWTGDFAALRGCRLLLVAEQGLGDTLQFCRYVLLLLAHGAQVILRVQAPLIGLLAQSPGWSGRLQLITMDQPLPEHDLFCPLMSLPWRFATELASVPAFPAYLGVQPEAAALWHARLPQATGQRRIGVAWSGNRDHHDDERRSLPLSGLQALFAEPCEFHCLQPEVREEDRDALDALPEMHFHCAELSDFTATAGLIEHLDLVISADTAVAHLAGALGKPVWVLLPFNPDHRWGVGAASTPWYPSARLFRQVQRGDWAGVVAQVIAALRATA